jgi:hypothetical protein
MTVESWLEAAIADAERRGLTGLKPILEALARSTAALREADRKATQINGSTDQRGSGST